MDPVITTQTIEGGETVLTAKSPSGTASVHFANLPHIDEVLISPELRDGVTVLETSFIALNTRLTTQIVGVLHPARVSDAIAAAIISLITPAFSRMVSLGIAEKRAIDEAYQRIIAVQNPDDPLHQTLQRMLISADSQNLMKMLGKDTAPKMLAAAFSILDLLDLPEAFGEDIERRHAIAQVIRRHVLAPDAARVPTASEPMAHGVDATIAVDLAERLIDRHRARTEAVDQIQATLRHIAAAVAVLTGRPVDTAFEFLTRK